MYLKIHDGADSNAHQLGKFCGSELPGNNGSLVSTHNAVYLVFSSDSSYADHGFKLRWNTSDPGRSRITKHT